MDISEAEFFEFTWIIENFSVFRGRADEPISSPKFMVQFLHGSEWYLMLYPRGLKDRERIMCFLHRTIVGPVQVAVKYSLSMDDSDCEFQQIFKKESPSDKSVNIDVARYFGDVQKTEKEGDLKVVCRLKIGQSMVEDHGLVKPYPLCCSARTVVPVEKRNISWAIKGFASLPSQHEVSTSVVSASSMSPKLLLTLSWSDENLKGGGKLKMEVRELPELAGKSFLLGCSVRLLNSKDEHQKLYRRYFLFTSVQKNYWLWIKTYSDSVWNFELNIDRSDLFQRRDFFLRNGDLVLECDFAISCEPVTHILEGTGFVHPKPVTPSEPEMVVAEEDNSWRGILLRKFNDQDNIFKFFFVLILFLATTSRMFNESSHRL